MKIKIGKIKGLFLLLSLLLSLIAYGDEVKIELNPSRPVAGEVFQAVFRIFTNETVQPVINFSPFRVEVVGKNNYGVKTSTTWINGKFSSSREITIVYDLSASSSGVAGLRDINVQIGSKNLKHPSLTINVLKEPEVAADTFVMADVPKKSLFVGEGIVVRYYLYSKVPVSNLDIKKYPQLNNFLKRFLQEPDRAERVSVDGEIYVRTHIYGAKLFPEKVGELKIDPIRLSATVFTQRGNDPFGAFGARRESRVKTISSETVKIEVKPLPEDGKGANFTGLIGKHEFDLQVNSSRLIVNEPLELKLTVSGGGALENMETPNLIKHPHLEEFETNGDLKIQDAERAIKVFDYTFLPKANINIPASTISLTYFDPDSMRYVPVSLQLPEIIVAGGENLNKEQAKKINAVDEEKKSPVTQAPSLTLSKPFFESFKSWKSYIDIINLGLATLAILIALIIIVKKRRLPSFSQTTIPTQFKKGKFNLGEFARWMTPVISQSGKSPIGAIKDSNLSDATKQYFIDLLNSNDYKDYSYSKGQFKYSYRPEYFKELDKYIQSVKNEDTSRPS